MLAIVLAFLSFGILNNIIAQTYTVDISVNDVWWESKENFGADLNAVIYRDGEPIPPAMTIFTNGTFIFLMRDIGDYLFREMVKIM